MASLKSLRTRIKSVKSTQKITKAMKMVAAAKLRRAKEAAEAARPYAERMERVLWALAGNITALETAPRMMSGSGREETHLLIVATSDRGLCGAFNSSIVRAARRRITELSGEGKKIKLFCVGRKAYDLLKTEHKERIVGHVAELSKRKLKYEDALQIAQEIAQRFEAGEFDVATLIYNHFKSAITQIVTFQQLIPLPSSDEGWVMSDDEKDKTSLETQHSPLSTPYEYEPSEEEILADLLPRNLAVQIYRGLLENAASEQGARMTAMDNATRNAGEMIKKLTLVYNRTRQAAITKELIEIISGAEAL